MTWLGRYLRGDDAPGYIDPIYPRERLDAASRVPGGVGPGARVGARDDRPHLAATVSVVRGGDAGDHRPDGLAAAQQRVAAKGVRR